MTAAENEWLVRSLDLTAPECYVLQHGQESDGRWVVKLTLMELLAQQVFRRVGAIESTSTVLVPGAAFSRSLPSSTGAIREIFLAQPRIPVPGREEGGVGVVELTQAIQRKFLSLNGFVTEAVMPTLIGRGYYRIEEYKILFLIPARRFVLTPAGQKVKHELERSLMAGQRQFTSWAAEQPWQALRFLQEMGSAALLLRPLYSDIQKIALMTDEEVRRREPEDDPLFDLLDFLREALPLLVEDMASIEAAVDAGGDASSGGDAGDGGDGGGD